METHRFGAAGPAVPAIGQGTWYLEQAPRAAGIAALRRGLTEPTKRSRASPWFPRIALAAIRTHTTASSVPARRKRTVRHVTR